MVNNLDVIGYILEPTDTDLTHMQRSRMQTLKVMV